MLASKSESYKHLHEINT